MRLQQLTVYTGQPLLATLLRSGLLEEVLPVHDPARHHAIMPKFWSPFPSTTEIRDYYGDSVALYFEWMQFMMTWLSIPGVAGLAVYTAHIMTGTPSRHVVHVPQFRPPSQAVAIQHCSTWCNLPHWEVLSAYDCRSRLRNICNASERLIYRRL